MAQALLGPRWSREGSGKEPSGAPMSPARAPGGPQSCQGQPREGRRTAQKDPQHKLLALRAGFLDPRGPPKVVHVFLKGSK
eukprot:387802-Pyramimonas_sp.AAC.1